MIPYETTIGDFLPRFLINPEMKHYMYGFDIHVPFQKDLSTVDFEIDESLIEFAEDDSPVIVSKSSNLLMLAHKNPLWTAAGLSFELEDGLMSANLYNGGTPNIAILLGGNGYNALREIYAERPELVAALPSVTAASGNLEITIPVPESYKTRSIRKGIEKFLQQHTPDGFAEFERDALEAMTIQGQTMKRENGAYRATVDTKLEKKCEIATNFLYLGTTQAQLLYFGAEE